MHYVSVNKPCKVQVAQRRLFFAEVFECGKSSPGKQGKRATTHFFCAAVGVGNLSKALEEGSKPDDYMAYDGSTALVMAATQDQFGRLRTWRTICFSAEMPYMVCTPPTVARCHGCDLAQIST